MVTELNNHGKLFIDGREINFTELSIDEYYKNAYSNEATIEVFIKTKEDIDLKNKEKTTVETKEQSGRFEEIDRIKIDIDNIGHEIMDGQNRYMIVGKYERTKTQEEIWMVEKSLFINGEKESYDSLYYERDSSNDEIFIEVESIGFREIPFDYESEVEIVESICYTDKNKIDRTIIKVIPENVHINIEDTGMILEVDGYYTTEKQTERPELENIDEYQERASETSIFPDELPEWLDAGVVYTAMGLAGEAGEVLEKVKKAIREDDKEYIEEAKDELGDTTWYASQFAEETGEQLSDIMQDNLDKLEDRKDRDVLEGQGDNR